MLVTQAFEIVVDGGIAIDRGGDAPGLTAHQVMAIARTNHFERMPYNVHPLELGEGVSLNVGVFFQPDLRIRRHSSLAAGGEFKRKLLCYLVEHRGK